MWRAIAATTLLMCGIAAAETDAFDTLEKSLPKGWSLLETEHELVIRHDRPCYVTGVHHENDAPQTTKSPGNPCGGAGADGPLVTLELRFHTEAKWTQRQLDDAKLANDRVSAEIAAAYAKERVGDIHKSKGRPLPANAAEQKRLSAFEKAEEKLKARLVRTPMCTFGEHSLFDGDQTYAQLMLKVDPPEATVEAHKIIELVKQQCGAH